MILLSKVTRKSQWQRKNLDMTGCRHLENITRNQSFYLGSVFFSKVSFSGMLSPWGGQPGCWWFEADIIELPDLQIKIQKAQLHLNLRQIVPSLL